MACEDYGANATVKISATIPGSGTTPGRVIPFYQRIPMDISRDNPAGTPPLIPTGIARKWAQTYNLTLYEWQNSDGDIDKDNAGIEKGDELCNFDEYRGFWVTENDNLHFKHVRTDPLKRDVFVWDPHNLFLNCGIYDNSPLPALTELTYHRITQSSQMDQINRRLNAYDPIHLPLSTGLLNYNFNGKIGQFPIGLEIVDEGLDIGGSDVGANAFTHQMDGEMICVKVTTIETAASDLWYNAADFKKFVVQHETCHKLSLSHNVRTVMYSSITNINKLQGEYYSAIKQGTDPDYKNLQFRIDKVSKTQGGYIKSWPSEQPSPDVIKINMVAGISTLLNESTYRVENYKLLNPFPGLPTAPITIPVETTISNLMDWTLRPDKTLDELLQLDYSQKSAIKIRW